MPDDLVEQDVNETPPVETPPVAPDTAEAQTRFRDWLSERNYDVEKYQSDEDVLADLEAAYQRARDIPPPDEIERINRIQPLVQEYAENAGDFQKWRESQKQQGEEPKGKPEAPRLTTVTQRLIDAGILEPDPRTGLYTGDPQFAQQVREANEVIQWQREAAQRVITDPIGFLRDSGFDDHLKSIVEPFDQRIAELEKRLEASVRNEVRSTIATFFNDHAEEFWEKHPTTGALTEKLTPVGEAVQDAIQSARDLMGVAPDATPSPEQELRIHEFVQKVYDRIPESEPEGETRKRKQEKFVQKAKRNGQVNRLEQRDATVAAAAEREAQSEENDDAIWAAAFKEAESELT